MATYSAVEDLLTGKIPLPATVDPQKFVNDATDEVDTFIGFTYVTPVDISAISIVPRPVRLLLKRLANHLATGRLIMAVAGGSEMKTVHAYGKSLVDEAVKILKEISEGKISLIGVEPVVTTDPIQTGPLINNKDPESNVDAFYDRILTPGKLVYPYPMPVFW